MASSDEIRLSLMREIDRDPRLSQRELAGRLSISLGKTNYCLRALIAKGWVKMKNFRDSDRKLAYTYILTPAGLRAKGAVTAAFLERKQLEFLLLQRQITQLQQEIARNEGQAVSGKGLGR
jgi:EPS-associated MarR family transcriptional regulator